MAEKTKLSPVEGVKTSSGQLRGSIPEELVDGTAKFSKDSTQLLKHHGTYQQDDRDARAEMRAAGAKKSDKAYIFMVRTKIPGGKLTSEQLLAELDLCEEVANSTLRITSRQGLQLHGVLKDNLHQAIRRINEIQLSTLGACGDVNRNVMCCPGPHEHDPVHQQMQQLAGKLAAYFAPRTSAYYEIWLKDPETGDKELVAGGSNGKVIEPIYGDAYLPRKFKMGIALPGDNCIDVYTHDLGLVAICEDYKIVGYNLLVGGGQGKTPSAEKTFPALGQKLCFATPEEVVAVAEAVVKVQRDFGNRADRKVARLKYLLHDWGMEKFRAKVAEYYGAPLTDPHPTDVWGFDDHIGWHEQGHGRFYYGLNVENGRLKDEGDLRIKSAVREICRTLRPGIRLTSHQSILFTDLPEDARGKLEEILKAHNVPLSEEISNARRWSMACVAWPTCGLSITESERALPGMIDRLEVEVAKLGLSKEVFTIRMTGCPNGCARPYNCDIGLVGRAAGKYTVYVGGRLLGDRLNFIYRDMVEADDVVPVLVTLFHYFKQERQAGESFGEFCARKGSEDLNAWAEDFEAAVT